MNAIIVHGGAWTIPERIARETMEGCRAGAVIGKEELDEGASAVDAVEAAIREMESNPIFDAGRGSVLTMKGDIEMDAMIMDGNGLRLGSVASVKSILHPVSLARKVMEETPHCLFVGEGANHLADRFDFPKMKHKELLSPRQLARWKEICKEEDFDIHQEFRAPKTEKPSPLRTRGQLVEPCDTVGACALDEMGNVAAGVSTGGTSFKYPGRVGDSPLVGCGGYADNRYGAVAATGLGEYLMRSAISSRVMFELEGGKDPEEAAVAAIGRMEADIGGLGGVVVLSKNGDTGLAYNTPRMAYAIIGKDGKQVCGV